MEFSNATSLVDFSPPLPPPQKKTDWQSAVRRPLLSHLSVTQRYFIGKARHEFWGERDLQSAGYRRLTAINKSIGEQIVQIAERLISAGVVSLRVTDV